MSDLKGDCPGGWDDDMLEDCAYKYSLQSTIPLAENREAMLKVARGQNQQTCARSKSRKIDSVQKEAARK